jgi:hypothetical protein
MTDRGPGDLAGDLERAVVRLQAVRAAYDEAFYRFSVDATGQGPQMAGAEETSAAAGELDGALQQSLHLAGLYRRRTRQVMRAAAGRSGRAIAARWAVVMSAYARILEACPEVEGLVKEGAPEVVEAIARLRRDGTYSTVIRRRPRV